MECNICFCQIDNNFVKCYDKKCSAVICNECIISYMNFCTEQSTLPKCVSVNCGKTLLFRNINKNNILADIYGKILVKYFEILFADQVKNIQGSKMYLEKYRKDRDEYIESLPKCIYIVAKAALSDKITKIEAQYKKKLKTSTKTTFRSCIELYCDGILDDNFTCTKCGIIVCNKCKQKKNAEHTCKQEDIDSIEFVDSLIDCPKCHVKILKSWGCDMMTCSHCRTNFDYKTGKVTYHGNHKNDEKFEMKDSTITSRLGMKYPNLTAKFSQIEMYRPKYVKSITLSLLESKKNKPEQLCYIYDRFLIDALHNNTYIQMLKSIDELSDTNKLTDEILDKIIGEMKTTFSLD